jgi:hypothetical protein
MRCLAVHRPLITPEWVPTAAHCLTSSVVSLPNPRRGHVERQGALWLRLRPTALFAVP